MYRPLYTRMYKSTTEHFKLTCKITTSGAALSASEKKADHSMQKENKHLHFC